MLTSFLHSPYRNEVQAQSQTQAPQDGMLTRVSRADQVVEPLDEFTQNFSKQRIAEVYLEEADDYEKAASKLREQAKEICGEVVLALEGDETPTHRPARRPTQEQKREEPDALDINEPAKLEIQDKTPAPAETKSEVHQTPEDQGTKAPVDATAPPTQASANEAWIPLAVRQMPPTQIVATSNAETFTFDLIKSELGGAEWSPGFYFISPSNPKSAHDLPLRSYWLLETENEPFLPTSPGPHGAKLTAFFNETIGEGKGHYPEEEDYDNVPVFICTDGMKTGEYKYFGHYRQTRYSDKVDMDHLLTCVPEKVRRYHAEQLANTGRPAWVTEALKQHFWPRDEYLGPLPTDSALNTPLTEATGTSGIEKRVIDALIDYANDLKEWEKEANLKVSLLTADSLMQAFSKADADEEPGLRLSLEYFQFLRYEQGFYEYLVKIKRDPKKYERPAKAAFEAPKGPKAMQLKKNLALGGKMVKANGEIETLQPASATAPAASKVRLSDKSAIPTEESELQWIEDKKPQSVKTAVNTGRKSLTQVVQPQAPQAKNETAAKPKAAEATGTDSLVKSGNLDAAKVLQKEFKSGSGKEKGKGGGPGGGKKGGPPHLRG